LPTNVHFRKLSYWGEEDAIRLSPDPLVGTWRLDPESLDYQHGRPGRRATYIDEAHPAGLMFTLDGEDADRKPMKFTYGGALDGRDQPLPGRDAVLVLTRYDERNIESALKRSGKVVGAIGVSGGSGDQDHAVAQAGAAAF